MTMTTWYVLGSFLAAASLRIRFSFFSFSFCDLRWRMYSIALRSTADLFICDVITNKHEFIQRKCKRIQSYFVVKIDLVSPCHVDYYRKYGRYDAKHKGLNSRTNLSVFTRQQVLQLNDLIVDAQSVALLDGVV